MTGRITALRAMEEAVANGELHRRDEDRHFFAMPCQDGSTVNLANVYSAHKGSLDAAKALHDALLPGWMWLARGTDDADIVCNNCSATCGGFANIWGGTCPNEWGPHFSVFAETPARAWLIAIIRALISQEATQ